MPLVLRFNERPRSYLHAVLDGDASDRCEVLDQLTEIMFRGASSNPKCILIEKNGNSSAGDGAFLTAVKQMAWMSRDVRVAVVCAEQPTPDSAPSNLRYFTDLKPATEWLRSNGKAATSSSGAAAQPFS